MTEMNRNDIFVGQETETNFNNNEIMTADDTNEIEIDGNLADDMNSNSNSRHQLLLNTSSELNNCSELKQNVEIIDENKINLLKFSYELQQAHKIVKDLMSDGHKGVNGPFMGPIGEVQTIKDLSDYNEVIKKPIWLAKVKEKIFKEEYKTLTEVIADIRLMLENCYRYHGPNNIYTKKGLRIEQILEQKLALLPRDLREKTTLEATYGRPCCEEVVGTRRRSTRQSMEYSSFILNQVKHERDLRDKEHKKKQIEEKKAEKEEKEKEIIDWENTTLLAEPLNSDMKAMWELPLIGLFLYLCQTVLNMPEVSIYELERILAMPRASTLLPKIMTSLLSNSQQRLNLDRKPPMPYKVWQNRLLGRVQSWYKIHQARNNRADLVFQQLGIEADFFRVMGPENPLLEKKFHELTFQQRVWVIKSLCDYIMHCHKTVQDTLNEKTVEDMREYDLGLDAKGNTYLHFPQFCGQDLRIYRRSKVTKPPGPIKWGAISARKRQTPENTEQVSPASKKSKTSDSSSPSPPNSPARSDTPSPELSTTRRSSRLSKLNGESPSMEIESCQSCFSEDEDESVVEESDDEDISLDPNISKFELIVDSVESLRKLINSLKPSKVVSGKKLTQKQKDESELRERLNNLLEELEPWETKLQKATQRLRQKLRKEWDEFVEKEEEIEDDIWGSDGESEPKKSSSIESSSCSDDSSSSSDDEDFNPDGKLQSSNLTQGIEKSKIDADLFGSSEFGEFRTRGQWRQLKNLQLNSCGLSNIVRPKTNLNTVVKTNGAENPNNRLSQQNCTSKGNAWETLEQILGPNSSSVLAPVNTVSTQSKSSAFNSLDEILTTSMANKVTTYERKNITKAEADILGAIQAATSLAKSHDTAESDVSDDSNDGLPEEDSEVDDVTLSESNCMNSRPLSIITTSSLVTCNSQVLATSKQASVLNNCISSESGYVNSALRENEQSLILRSLLEQANNKARSKNNTVKLGGNSIATEIHNSSNAITSVKFQDGKLIYQPQPTPFPSGSTILKTTASQVELSTPPTCTTSNTSIVNVPKPQLLTAQPTQQVMLFPIKDQSGKIVQYVSIPTSTNNNVSLNGNICSTNVVSSTPRAVSSVAVSNISPTKTQFQSFATSASPSQNLMIPVTEQKMILIPVSNHQGQTTYLQVPTNSIIASPTTTDIKSSNVMATNVASIVSPIRPTPGTPTNSRVATLPMSQIVPTQNIVTEQQQQLIQNQRPRTSAAVVPRNVCYRPTPIVNSISHTCSSNTKIPAAAVVERPNIAPLASTMHGTPPKMASPTGLSGIQISGSNTNLTTLLANNPTLSANIQKLAMTGRKVVISQQGGKIIIQATPNESAVKSLSSTQRPNPVTPVLNVTIATPQVNAKPPVYTVASRTMTRPSQVLNVSTVVPGVPMPVVPQMTAVPKHPTNLVRMPNVSVTPPNLSLVQAVPAPNLLTVTNNNMKTSVPTTTLAASLAPNLAPTHQASMKSKLVMIHNIDTGKQNLGLLLDNGQVLPLNATVAVSGSNPTTITTTTAATTTTETNNLAA